jgi:hypothetical protein
MKIENFTIPKKDKRPGNNDRYAFPCSEEMKKSLRKINDTTDYDVNNALREFAQILISRVSNPNDQGAAS